MKIILNERVIRNRYIFLKSLIERRDLLYLFSMKRLPRAVFVVWS